MILFVILLMVPISFIIYLVFKPLKKQRRLAVSAWYAFYFTVPLLVYDSIYCGWYLGYGMDFFHVFWYLSIFYIIPWLHFPAVAVFLNRFRQ